MLIYPVKKGDILIEIKKPKSGKNGRNCKGEIILAKRVRKFEIPTFFYDEETIKKGENEDNILFLALKNGYLYKEKDEYVIKDSISINQIDIKTGDVKGARDSDVKIEVTESDALKESIGDNSVVETSVLSVKGNVGNSAFIKCKDLKVYGQTHKKSKIFSDKAEINIHKGFVEGKEIKIDRLEGGIVKGNRVFIFQAIGGKIYAKEINIDLLGSHIQCYALEKIIINTIIGEENKLIISPQKVLGNIDVDSLKKKLNELKRILDINVKQYKKNLQELSENKEYVKKLKVTYLENKSKGLKTPYSLIKKIKEFEVFKNKTYKLKIKIENIKKEINEIENTIKKIQNITLFAKIISFSPWKAFNRIGFDLIEPPIKLVYDTKGNEGVYGFKLKKENKNFKIVKIKVREHNDSGT
jgi:thiol-disulfide isomerase/thioredoxin